LTSYIIPAKAGIQVHYLPIIEMILFSPISALSSNFNPRNTSMYSCG